MHMDRPVFVFGSDLTGQHDRGDALVAQGVEYGQDALRLLDASDEAGVREFAGRISAAVRELGLHHPRSSVSKFVTVSFEIGVSTDAAEGVGAKEFLNELVSRAEAE